MTHVALQGPRNTAMRMRMRRRRACMLGLRSPAAAAADAALLPPPPNPGCDPCAIHARSSRPWMSARCCAMCCGTKSGRSGPSWRGGEVTGGGGGGWGAVMLAGRGGKAQGCGQAASRHGATAVAAPPDTRSAQEAPRPAAAAAPAPAAASDPYRAIMRVWLAGSTGQAHAWRAAAERVPPC